MSPDAKPAWPKSPPELVERFASAMGGFPAAERRAMFGYPCAFLNGHMFTGLHGEQWFVPFEPMPGRPMTGYAVLPYALTLDSQAAHRWVARAGTFVGQLPPKTSGSRRGKPKKADRSPK